MSLHDKVVVVIGASSGIGEGIVRALDEVRPRGIVLAARRVDKLEEIARSLHTDKLLVPTDIQDYTSVENLMRTAVEKYGRIDFIINSAGIIQQETDLEDLPIEKIMDVIGTNLTGALFVGKAVLPYFLKQRSGTMLVISSIAGKNAYSNEEAYCASKAGVDHYIRALDDRLRALRSSGNSIYAFAVGPGLVDTVEARKQFPDVPEDVWQNAPKPLDFGRTVLTYLTDPETRYNENGAVQHIETVNY